MKIGQFSVYCAAALALLAALSAGEIRAQDYLTHDFATGDGGFTVVNGIGAGVPAGPWVYSSVTGKWSANGGEGVVNSALVSPPITIPDAGGVGVAFDHRYFFEDDGTTRWDGGQIQYSVNGSDYLPVVADSFLFNGYAPDRLITGNSPPIAGQYGFNGKSEGYDAGSYITSIASIGSVAAGDQLSLRFIGAWDEGYIEPSTNWELSNLTVFHDDNPIVYPVGRYEMQFDAYTDIAGLTLAELRSSPKFPDNPDSTTFVAVSEIPVNKLDNYGARLSGYFTPDETGLYDFYMASDDQGELYLSTDADPANKLLIANEPEWNPSHAYSATDRRNAAAPENRSTTLFPAGIPLVAGNSYYIEALMKEGGGGDNLSFTAALRIDPATPAPIPLGPIGSPLCNCGAVPLGQLSTVPVPEPSSVALIGVGILAFGLGRRKRIA